MIHFFPYLISFCLGFLAISFLLKNTKPISLSLHLLLALGLGLGFSSFITFFSFLFLRQFNALAIVTANLLFLILLIYLNFSSLRSSSLVDQFKKSIKNLKPLDILIACCWLILSGIILFLIQKHPYGEWDAWAMWNLKTKFLLFSQTPWQDILSGLNWHTHPDYPLFLPFVNVWIYSFFANNLFPIPLITSFLFTVSACLLVYAALKHLNLKPAGIFASLLLLSHPYFIFWSTAQYADIVLAYYLLAAFVTMIIMMHLKDHRVAILYGLFLGFLSFIKNEGMVMTGILASVTTLYLIFDKTISKKTSWSLIRFMLIGLIVAALPTIIFKVFLAPPNEDILPSLKAVQLNITQAQKFLLIQKTVFNEIIDKRWSFIWLLVILLGILKFPKLFYKENKIISFSIITYIAILIFIYLVNTNIDIHWWLSMSLERLYLQLLPSILFLSFFCYWSDQTTKLSPQHSEPAKSEAKNLKPRKNPEILRYAQDDRNRITHWICFLIMAGLFIYTLIRAYNISITHDEALTYLRHASASFLQILTFSQPHPSNNHLLNSLLIKISVNCFGLSEFAIRIPALIGHALFLFAAYKICSIVLRGPSLIAGLLLLTCNPYMLDLFSCARGYALGLGFLALGLYYFFKILMTNDILLYRKNLILCSWLLVLATLSNLAFLHIHLAIIMFLFGFELLQSFREKEIFKRLLKNLFPSIILSSIVVGALYIVPLQKLLTYHELYYGGDKGFWTDTVTSLIDSTLYAKAIDGLNIILIIKFLIISILTLSVAHLAQLLIMKKPFSSTDKFLMGILTILFLCASLIFLQWKILGTKFVMGRTALYFVFLFMMVVVILIGVAQSIPQKALRLSAQTFFYALTTIYFVHFLGCANIKYFYEWQFDASTKDAVKFIMQDAPKTKNLNENSVSLGINWLFEPSINFYREKYHLTWLKQVNRQGPNGIFDYYYLTTPKSHLPESKDWLQDFFVLAKYNLKVLKNFDVANTLLATKPNPQINP